MTLLDLFISILIFLPLISLLVFVHEGGHFLLAKFFKVEVEEFGFGLPPRLWGKEIKGTIYSINKIPLGGFVRLKGEEGEEGPGSFSAKGKLARFLIIFAGAVGNLFLAWFIFTLLFAVGYPEPRGKVRIEEVAENSPAQEAGIVPGDFVVSFEDIEVSGSAQLKSLTQENLGKEVTLTLEREGAPFTVKAYARPDPPSGQGALGILMSDEIREISSLRHPVYRAPILALAQTADFTLRTYQAIFSAFGKVFTKLEAPEDVAGPIGILGVLGRILDTFSRFGVVTTAKILALFGALISLSLGVINLFPFPALDGGRILFLGIEALRGKKVSPKTEALVHRVGFVLLIWLAILISIRDVKNLFF